MTRKPSYYRARIAVIDRWLKEMPVERTNHFGPRTLLKNGVVPENMRFLLEQDIDDITGRFTDVPLTFYELTRYNTWFVLHPEKVAGKEEVTTSFHFPITIVGTKQDILATLRGQRPAPKSAPTLMKIKAKALQLKLKLLNFDSLGSLQRLPNGHPLSGLGGLAGIGSLGKVTEEAMVAKRGDLIALLKRSQEEKKYNSRDALSFDDVVRLYNPGITPQEIKAWVWYKRSTGVAMRGWDKYFLPSTGQKGDLLVTTRETTVKDNHFRDIAKVAKGVSLGKPTRFKNEYAGENYLVYRSEDNALRYVPQSAVKVEKASISADPKTLDQFVRDGLLFVHSDELLPYPIYANGNMYDKDLQLQADKADIVQKYGQEVYDRQAEIIQRCKPKLISIINPDPRERPKILAISEFARNFTIKSLREETGIELAEGDFSLRDVFAVWLSKLPQNDFKEVTAWQIAHYYLEGHNLNKNLTDEEKETIQKYAGLEGEDLFSRFLYEAVPFEDQNRIDFTWNRLFNGHANIPYQRVPIGFRCSAMFKTSVLQFTPAQREGVAFMELAGSGIVAYDVGVGKTMCAIITLANAMYYGKATRPLIVVPNPTYGKWIKEIIGFEDKSTGQFVPGVLSNIGVKVNEWYNLGTDILKKIDLSKPVPANTITIVTYEGLAKIGYGSKVMAEMFEELARILAQVGDQEKSKRDIEKQFQKYRELIGVGNKGTEADIDALGFDYLVVDEAHNFKNVFADVPQDEDGVKRFKITGAESQRAMKLFFLANYVQRRFGANVMALTATPFTNSPLEIYSMLSLVAHHSLLDMGYTTLQTFMETFVLQSLEFVNSYDDTIKQAFVVKAYNNRLVLQKLIHNHITYKTGEEAGVKRPCKISLPRVNAAGKDGVIRRLDSQEQILTYLAMTPIQRDNQREIVDLARKGTALDGNIMRAMGQSLDNALSPFLYKYSSPPEDYLEYVQESPKINYTMQCIASVKAWHEERGEPVSGQVIYMNRGKDYFPLIKEYLEKELGYQTKVKHDGKTFDEVEIITSGLSADKKEGIKDAFLAGTVKIIIGTATIREGIDMQKKGTVIYNLYPDWNPTDVKQLEGRIWRQGNEFAYVRSVMPLVQDSMDVFVFQKLEEKTARINDIWYRGDRGNVIDLESLDPEEVKFALFTNLEALAKMTLDKEVSDVSRRSVIVKTNLEVLEKFTFKLQQYRRYRELCLQRLRDSIPKYGKLFFPKAGEFRAYVATYWWRRLTEPNQEALLERAKELLKETEEYLASATQDDKTLLRLGRQFYKLGADTDTKDSGEDIFSEFKSYMSEVRKAERTILASKGYTLDSDIGEVIEAYLKDRAALELEAAFVSSADHRAEVLEAVRLKKEKLQIIGKSIEERAQDFASLNYLLQYKAQDMPHNACGLPDPGERTQRTASPQDRPAVPADKNGGDRRLQLIRIRAKALKLKLQLENF